MTTATMTPELATGMDIFWFTKGNRGLLCRVTTIWPKSGEVTIMPHSRTEPSVTIKRAEVHYGATLCGKTLHYCRSGAK